MNDLILEFNDEVIAFDIEQYNQLHVVNTKTFLKLMFRMKNLEGEKFDDFYQQKFKGNTLLYNQKINGKNTLVLDLNDFSKIINNLSFHKESIIKKTYLADLHMNVETNDVDSIVYELLKQFEYNDIISLDAKDIGIEKLFETLFSGHIDEKLDPLSNTYLITKLVIDYMDKLELKNALLIVDSSLKFFDLQPLIDDERIIILDTNIQYNQNTNNLLIISDTVEAYSIENIIEKVEFHWPIEIDVQAIMSLLQVYWYLILNDEMSGLDYPSDNLVCLYIIVRKLLGLSININTDTKYQKTNDKICNFISDNLVK